MDPAVGEQCPRCKAPGVTFLPLAWQCAAVREYWETVMDRIGMVVKIPCPTDPLPSLLGNFKRGIGHKMAFHFRCWQRGEWL